MRIGHGYDVHRLVENRDLILGGVKIDYCLGLLGHSDADVLLHAISDALLGAAALTFLQEPLSILKKTVMRYAILIQPYYVRNPSFARILMKCVQI